MIGFCQQLPMMQHLDKWCLFDKIERLLVALVMRIIGRHVNTQRTLPGCFRLPQH